MPETLFDRLDRLAEEAPDRVAMQTLDREPLTRAGLHSQIGKVVASLTAAGVGRGDRVAIVLPHGPELATACLGVMAGAVAAPLNPEYRQDEYAFYLSSIRPRVVVVEADRESPVRLAARALDIPVLELRPLPGAPAGVFTLDVVPEPAAVPGAAPRADDGALVLHTSGTTARPRTVPLSQGNLLASIEHLATSLRLDEDDCCLHMLPMHHIGGIVDVLAAPLARGGAVVCASGFSAPEFFACLAAFRPTWAQAVPAMIGEIVACCDDYPDVVANHRLRFMRSVSAPLPVKVMKAFEERFDTPVIEIYGMTETAGVIASNPLPDAARKPGSVGLPAGPEVRIVDAAGVPLPAGQVGEVVVRGPGVMAGYEGGPGANAGAFFAGGWLRTGDQGRFDADGYLFLTGRIKEIINRGGEKISPWEVDEIARSHPAVADAAAFAVAHDSLGEDVALAVVPKTGQAVTRHDLVGYLAARLAYFKVPRHVVFVERIPRTAGGKLQRLDLARTLGVSDRAAPSSVSGEARPESAVGRAIAASWQRILKVDGIGNHDDFFDLGGDSLKAASFVNELQRQWGENVYVSAVFDAPTVVRFEAYLNQHYPELSARILGRTVSMDDRYAEGRVDDAMVSAFRCSIVRTTGDLRAPARKNSPAVFILSAPRSGSTLLRAMLAGHSRLFAPPELYLLSFDDLADRSAWFSGSQRFQLEGNVRAVMQARGTDAAESQALVQDLERRRTPVHEYYRMLQEWVDGRMLVDKTPYYGSRIETLERAETIFDAPVYVHLLRHPYGMIRSFEEARLEQLWYPRLVGVEAARAAPCPYTRRELAELIWLVLNQNMLSFLDGVPQERQLRIRFEDLVGDPRRTAGAICGLLGIELEESMLHPHDDSRRRMTDGLHSESRMIGDMKFHQHRRIDNTVADRWKEHYQVDFLADATRELAARLGYVETVAALHGRTEFEI